MKVVTASFTLSLLATAAVFAEDPKPAQAPAPEVPAPDSSLKLSLPGSPTAPSATNENLGLIPETPEVTAKPKGSAIPEAKPSRKASDNTNKTSIAEDELAERIRLRQLKTRVSAEPKVIQLREQARAAKTDHDRREALRTYYKLYYGRIEQLDGSLKKRVAELRNTSLNRINQKDLKPSQAIEDGI